MLTFRLDNADMKSRVDRRYKQVSKKNINDAISELKILYNKKILLDKPNFHSIQWLKAKLKRLK